MQSFTYNVPNVELSKLAGEIAAAGFTGVQISGGALGSPDVYVTADPDLSPQDRLALDALVAIHDGRPRRPRPFLDLQAAINALTPAQKTAVANDLFGPSNRWAADVATNRGSLAVLWGLTQLGLTAVQVTAVKVTAAALYCQDFPAYLVTPAFAPSINIPGDEPFTVTQPAGGVP